MSAWMVECLDDVRIILKLGLSDRQIFPAGVSEGPRFGTVSGHLRVEDLLSFTCWVEILNVKLKEGEKPVKDIHWADSLVDFVPRSLVLADDTVAGYTQGTSRKSIFNGHLQLWDGIEWGSNGYAPYEIVRVLPTELDPGEIVEKPCANLDDIPTPSTPSPFELYPG